MKLGTLTHYLKRGWLILAVLIIFAAVFSSLFRALTPWAKQYKTSLEQHLTVLLNEPVTIGSMETGWYWFEPVIKLKQVTVKTGKYKPIQLKKLLVGINLFSSLWHWQIQPGVLYVEDLNLTIRQKEGGWGVDGLGGGGSTPISLNQATYQPILIWALAQQKIIIKNLSIDVYLKDKTHFPFKQLNFIVVNRSALYHIQGETSLVKNTTSSFQLLAQLSLDPYSWKSSSGQIYFSVANMQFSLWQSLFQDSPFKIKNGQADVQLWLDLHKGNIKKVQSRLDFQRLAWQYETNKATYFLNYFKANLAWQPSKKGWNLTTDHLTFGLGKDNWPQNKFSVRYQENNNTYYVYVKHIILESLVKNAKNWINKSNQFIASQPHGELIDTQFTIKEKQLDYLLTNFSNLGWKAIEGIPGVENLAGALHWQPSEGLLELDGENTVVNVDKKPAVSLQKVNASFKWKELSDGLRLSIDRFVLTHPDLIVAASGRIGSLSFDGAGQVNLFGQVSAKNIEHWLAYLPKKLIKPKFYAWLREDVKHVNSLVGEVTLNGLAADFPFDKTAGEFLIKGYIAGVDLAFSHRWPVTNDIEAFLKVNKRSFEADVVHANLQGTLVNNGNLRVDNIGYDHETLLLHTKIDADSKNALAYILSSPFNAKLSALKMLKMKGDINLDLRMEAPLYPENDDILALGDVTFENNQVTVNHAYNSLEFNSLNGKLVFDQSGVLDSRLKATIMDYPVFVYIKSNRVPTIYTEVKIKGKTTIGVLQDKLKLPVFSVMHGALWLESLLTLTDNPKDLDHIKIQTSLHGVTINLPAPFGKSAEARAPLAINVDFNSKKMARVRVNYDNKISGDLWLSANKGQFKLDKGKINIGSKNAEWKQGDGLQIDGTLQNFDWPQWQAVFAKLALSNSSFQMLEPITLMDIMLKKLSFAGHDFNNMAIKANKVAKNDWLIAIEEPDIAAKLRLQTEINRLSGIFTKLHLQNNSFSLQAKNKSSSSLSLKPKDIPNLDLQIKSLQLGSLDIGEVKFKTSTHNQSCILESSMITTPFYQFTAKGQWSEVKGVSQTAIQTNLQISNLAKALELWSISPVVEARKGLITFQGSWPGAFYDFSVGKVSGLMTISFKNGRITHLSPETEEKLGLGKLLSILSLQTIPRRLKLDFSDLSHNGYSFDEFKGNFKVSNGLMNTADSYINGPIAYASMKGSLDIAKQIYDLDLQVSPHVTASLPIVATLAGGPIAGLATWVLSKIINQGMQKISGYTYKISGPWKQPVVQQVSILKQKKV